MFLHSGASLHGHEYSARPHSNAAAPRHTIPFFRSALRPLTDTESNAKSSARSLTSTPTPPRTTRPLSFADSPTTPATPSPAQWHGRRPRPVSECFPRRDQVVRFVEPEVEKDPEARAMECVPPASSSSMEKPCTPSEDEAVYSEASETNLSLASSGKKKKRRTPRSGTKFILAQPPGRVVKRHRRFIQLKPKLVLQLQQLTETRPKPAFDILPSAVLTGSMIAAPSLVRKFPRLFTSRGELASNDLILAKSEDYDADDDDGEDSLAQRELIAVISPRIIQGDNRTDIVLTDGTVWTASPMPNGSYEFVREDAEGNITTARWVKRRIPLEEEDDYKFTFSILDPSSRRHPIMATLTPATLEILDYYTTVSPSSSGKYPPSRPFSFDAKGASPPRSTEHRPDRMTLPVDEATKTLITVSSVWVTLHLLGVMAQKPPAAASAGHTPPSQPRSCSVQDRKSLCPLGAVAVESPKVCVSPKPLTTRHATEPITPVCTPLSQQIPMKRASSTGAAFMQRRRTAALMHQATDGLEMGEEGAYSLVAQTGTKKGLYSLLRKAFKRHPREVRV